MRFQPSRRVAVIAVVALTAWAGQAGAALTISNAPTSNMHCNAGVCGSAASSANLNTGDLQAMLAAGDVHVTANHNANDITVVDAFAWANGSKLTLESRRSLTVAAPVAVEGTGALVLITDPGNYGVLAYGDAGRIDFWDLHSKLRINTQGYTLIGDMGSLVKRIAANPSGSFAIAKDIVARHAFSSAPVAANFTGNLDGLGHAITKLRIRDAGDSNAGLFATSSGNIAHLGLVDVHIATGGVAGLVVGTNTGTLDGVHATGVLTDVTMGGGLVGTNNTGGHILRSSGAVQIRKFATVTLGGAAGYNAGIIDHTTGAVTGTDAIKTDAGGLVGYAGSTSNITNSSGSFAGVSLSHAGGLAGTNVGGIAASYASGNVQSFNDESSTSGGLVGWNSGSVVDCYATATVHTGGRDVGGQAGGLAGYNDPNGTVATSYSTGMVTAGNLNEAGGGLLGVDASTNGVSSSYWDLDTSGATQGAQSPQNDPGITGLSDVQLKAALPAGFNPIAWGQNPGINSGYPYLLNNPPQ